MKDAERHPVTVVRILSGSRLLPGAFRKTFCPKKGKTMAYVSTIVWVMRYVVLCHRSYARIDPPKNTVPSWVIIVITIVLMTGMIVIIVTSVPS